MNGSTESPEDMVAAFVARRRKAGQRAFIDGPLSSCPVPCTPDVLHVLRLMRAPSAPLRSLLLGLALVAGQAAPLPALASDVQARAAAPVEARRMLSVVLAEPDRPTSLVQSAMGPSALQHLLPQAVFEYWLVQDCKRE